MQPQTTPLEAITEEKRRGSKRKLLMVLLLFAHAGFYFAQSLYLPLSLEQLFTFGYVLILIDSGLVVFLGIKLLTKIL